MGLSNRKEEQLKDMPTIKTRVRKSNDGRFVINETTITQIRPTSYYEKVLSGSHEEEATA
ncbi:MAG: hypothetical protein OXR66_08740 [Candidatus Woesearchaeota archaeon]|nr:hypothetical protein [Candidatus Woesearchaeota archaeon]